MGPRKDWQNCFQAHDHNKTKWLYQPPSEEGTNYNLLPADRTYAAEFSSEQDKTRNSPNVSSVWLHIWNRGTSLVSLHRIKRHQEITSPSKTQRRQHSLWDNKTTTRNLHLPLHGIGQKGESPDVAGSITTTTCVWMNKTTQNVVYVTVYTHN